MLPLNELGTKRGREAKASIPWYCEVFCHETRLIPVCSWIYNVSRNISQDYSTLRLANDWDHILFEELLSKCRNHLRDIRAHDLGRVFAIEIVEFEIDGDEFECEEAETASDNLPTLKIVIRPRENDIPSTANSTNKPLVTL